MAYHINEAGEAGLCRATQAGGCPFGDAGEHYETQEEARSSYELKASELEESGQVWPPRGLPKKLIVMASMADLIRHYNDQIYLGGEGVCLGASAFVSHQLITQGTPHKLVRGEYIDGTGAPKAHWWLESAGWILDASRGQFEEDKYKSGVIRSGHQSYVKLQEFEPGHTSEDLVSKELQRCFGDPEEAESYLGELENLADEARNLFSENDKSVHHN